jgi:plasmid stabilization system protein ParE
MRPVRAYYPPMDTIEDNTPPGWLDSLAHGRAEIEAGTTVPMEPFLGRLRASITRMKARRQARRTAKSVVSLSPEAETQPDGLLTHFERPNRTAATENLLAALGRARARISRAPNAGLPAPRPYPAFARLGFRWVKEGRYWVAYTNDKSPIIVGVYHEAADIPNRV